MMSGDASHDPVLAVAEAEAAGETAAIFADIRETMQIPLVTSIWRKLADIEGGLSAVWAAAKPLHQTGQPAAALLRLTKRAALPLPEPIVGGQLACVGVPQRDLPVVRALVDAYNRSNGMNLMALTALIVPPSGAPASDPVPAGPPPWPALPPLLAQAGLTEETWTLLRNINLFGAVAGDSGLATLWRHLGHWPGLLAVIHAGLAPLQRDGTVQRSTRQVLDIAQAEGARLAHLRPEIVSMPEAAREMIISYVSKPGLVARMVTIGHGLARWLQAPDETGKP